MKRLGPIEAVLFDLDQTLTDRQLSFRKAAELIARHFSARLNPCPVETIYACLKRADGREFRRLFCAELCESLPWKSAPPAQELLIFWQQYFPQCTVEHPGATKVIKQLIARKIRVGILTNGDTQPQNEKIDALGIRPLLSCVIIEESVGISKPDPSIYHLALKGLNLPAKSVLFVGENPRSDIIVPRRLGMKTVWVSGVFKWPANASPPSHSIKSLSELPALL